MARHDLGPRRSTSVESYVWQTRLIGAAAALALVAAVVFDQLDNQFWDHHALLTDLVASLLVVGLSVAVINEVLGRRQRRRWSVLAQYVLFQLVSHARLTWIGLMQLSGLMPSGHETGQTLDASARAACDTPRVVAALRAQLADPDRRLLLRGLIERLLGSSDEVLGRWASMMVNSSAYAEIIDRHVELYSRIAWVGSLLNYRDTSDVTRRRRLSRGSPRGRDAAERRRRRTDGLPGCDRPAGRGARPRHDAARSSDRAARMVGGTSTQHDGQLAAANAHARQRLIP